jgi:hypothetical protein
MREIVAMASVKLTESELEQLRYAERNYGRNFVSRMEGEPTNEIIERLTADGFFVDGGLSPCGRWRNLTPAGRAFLASDGRKKGE